MKPIKWNSEKECVEVIDQRLLPYETKWLEIKTSDEMAFAIKDMVIRGAPLIGIGAAFGMAFAAQAQEDLDEADKKLRSTRPTAINLMWALDECKKTIFKYGLDKASCQSTDYQVLYKKLLEKAIWIHQDDIDRCKAMSKVGAEYIKEKFKDKIAQGKKLNIMTQCNAGALATGDYGTALGVIRELALEDLVEMVYANETRPRGQGSRLTVWEMVEEGIPVTLLADTMPGHTMKKGMVDLCVVGSDRVSKNGDAANKIGTYQVAILADFHKIPFFVAAPISTVDFNLEDGEDIPIEERDSKEIAIINDKYITPESGVSYFNPGFDVTPSSLIEAIFTEQGLYTKELINS